MWPFASIFHIGLYSKSQKPKLHWFCASDIGMCVMGIIRDVVLCKPTIPLVWYVKIGTNLTTTKVLMLNDGGFLLETLGEKASLSPMEEVSN